MKKTHTSFNESDVDSVDRQLKARKFFRSTLDVDRFVAVCAVFFTAHTLATIFVQSRLREIECLEKSINDPSRHGASGLRVFQRLPRHRRRRAMSHNIHLLPKYLISIASREPDVCHKLPSRIHHRIRRKRRRTRARRRRQHQEHTDDTPPSRLPTHIFHAKRFRMIKNLFSFSPSLPVPLFSVHKLFRPCYRFARQHCVVHDASYFVCVEICGVSGIVRDVLGRCGIRVDPGECECEIKGILREIVCPVRIVVREKAETETLQCLMWVHPCGMPEALSYVEHVCREEQRRGSPTLTPDSPPAQAQAPAPAPAQSPIRIFPRYDLGRIEIRGKHASTTLRRVISPASASGSGSDDSNSARKILLWNQIMWGNKRGRSTRAGISNRVTYPASFPRGMVIGLRIRHPLAPIRPDFGMVERILQDRDRDRRESGSMDLDVETEPTEATGGGVDPEDFLEPPRGVSAIVGENEIWDRRESSSTPQLSTTGVVDFDGDQEMDLGKKDEDGDDRKRPHSVLIIQQSGSATLGHFGYGWDIICSRSLLVHLWSSIMRNPTKVIALSLADRYRLRTEQGFPNFPSDYPGSIAFCNPSRTSGYLLQEVYKAQKKRLPTRIPDWSSYLRDTAYVNISFPLCVSRPLIFPPPPSARQWSRVEILCSWGGAVHPGASLYLARDDAEYESMREFPKRQIPEFDDDEDDGELMQQTEMDCGDDDDDEPPPAMDEEDVRVWVGFVTTGIRSLFRGQGYGIGVVVKAVLELAVRSEEGEGGKHPWCLMLLKNPGRNPTHLRVVKVRCLLESRMLVFL